MRKLSLVTKEVIKNFVKARSYPPLFFLLGNLFSDTKPQKINLHLKKSLEWLLGQQSKKGGFSTQYSLLYGQCQDFPETTGYIIPTLIDVYEKTGDKKYLDSAKRAGEWLLKIQNPEGWFPDASNYSKPMVFDSGQIIFGLLSLYNESNDEKYLKSAKNAGDWIVKQQNPQDFWQKYAYNEIPHTYYSRVSWALLELWKKTHEKRYKTAARKQLDWVLSQQQENGFFKNCSFFADETPVLHTIAYTTRSLLESGLILNEKKYIKSAQKTADKLLKLNQRDNPLFGYYGKNWQPKSKSRCLVGLAQISIILFKFYEITKNPNYLKEARKINYYLKTKQILAGPSATKGALSGSFPLWGKYMHFSFPNWAAKFWIDASLLEEKHKTDHLTVAIFPTDPLEAYIKKGEMRKSYWNPGNMFSEIHIFDFCNHQYSQQNKEKLQFMAGPAELFIHQLPYTGLKRLIFQRKIKKQVVPKLREIQPISIRAHGVFLEGFFAHWASKKLNIPFVLSLHGNCDLDNRYQVRRRKKYLKYLSYLIWKYLAELKTLRGADSIIAVYKFAADYAENNGVKKEKINIIYNRVYNDVFFLDSVISKNKIFTIINIGRLIPEKNQKILIEAIKDLDVKLIVIGQGPEKENLVKLAKKLNAAHKIESIDKIDNKELKAVYNKCHIYVSATLYGEIEIPAIEAMACGLPIIRPMPLLNKKEPELFGLRDCIFVENNPEGFKEGIQKLMKDKNLYKSLSEKSLKIYNSIKGGKMEQKEKEVYLNLL